MSVGSTELKVRQKYVGQPKVGRMSVGSTELTMRQKYMGQPKVGL